MACYAEELKGTKGEYEIAKDGSVENEVEANAPSQHKKERRNFPEVTHLQAEQDEASFGAASAPLFSAWRLGLLDLISMQSRELSKLWLQSSPISLVLVMLQETAIEQRCIISKGINIFQNSANV